MIRALGFSETRASIQIRAVQEEQGCQAADLQTILRFLLQNFISGYELIHLKKLASGEPFPFIRSDPFAQKRRKLLSLGLIPNKGIRSLFSAGDDVRNHLLITDRGKWYLAHLAPQLFVDIPSPHPYLWYDSAKRRIAV